MPGLARRWALPLLIVAALGALLLNRGFRRVVTNFLSIRADERRLSALQKEEGELKTQIERLKRNDAALENAARKELGYLKPGEIEYRFPPPK